MTNTEDATTTPESLVGQWAMVVNGPMGIMNTSLTIEYDGTQFSGHQNDEGVEPTPVIDMVLDGDTLTWGNQVVKPMSIKLSFTAEVAGTKMTGQVKPGFLGKFPFTAEKL